MLLNEQRKSRRKLLKVKATLTMEGAETIKARTLDVGGDGVCLLVGMAQKPGTYGMVRFDIFHDGNATTISARARVQYCILSNGEYKLGCQFVNLELSAMAALSRFLQ
jgi:c-di-GMP-binding flagellar brake protein YcgR